MKGTAQHIFVHICGSSCRIFALRLQKEKLQHAKIMDKNTFITTKILYVENNIKYFSNEIFSFSSDLKIVAFFKNL